ncbi:MAG: hypothetical protein KAH54_03215 [Candidatus Sabulitectum sp.]|nr:hypothetical protein [Candidatus Sabulitectum sp.]
MRIVSGGFILLPVLLSVPCFGNSQSSFSYLSPGTDARPDLVWEEHNLANLWSGVVNNGSFGVRFFCTPVLPPSSV